VDAHELGNKFWRREKDTSGNSGDSQSQWKTTHKCTDNMPCPKASLITCHHPILRDRWPKYKSNFLVLQALVIGMQEKKLPSNLSRALAPTGNLLS